MCGENSKLRPISGKTRGSPPRVRGKLELNLNWKLFLRITPACAGKTNDEEGKGLIQKDHPRVCGENVPFSLFGTRNLGSPPRVRGKPGQFCHTLSLCRITPACAGKTHMRYSMCVGRKDHPRVCGENIATAMALKCGEGSPPRVRGKPKTYNRNCVSYRITPACAGKT